MTDLVDLEAVQDTERHLLYVAATRARDRLHLSGVAPGSEFLDYFSEIMLSGISSTLGPVNRIRLELTERDIGDASPDEPFERRIEQMLINRKIREANFRCHVLEAYDSTCAVTGLRIVNGGGKVEAQAAHIWSVADGGPDIVQNGVALSATAHWLFDRYLISFDDDLRLLVSHNQVPSQLLQLFPASGERIRLPADPHLRPRPEFVARHRERFASHGLN